MLAAAAFLSTTLVLFLPGQLFFGNVTEFPMRFADVWPSLVLLALAGTAGVAVSLFLLPRGRARDRGLCVVFALGCLAFVQGNVPMWPYGILDGRTIDWSAYRAYGRFDVLLWSTGIVAAVSWRRTLARVLGWVSLVLLGVQAASLVLQASQTPDRWIDDVTFDDSTRFNFSPDRNVVVIVLDTFQTDLFQQLLDDDPGLVDRLPGFVYFRNATGGFPSTAASIPLMLSGQYYDNGRPFQEFVRTTYRTASLPETLTREGFDVYYHNPYFWPSLYADETIASHVRAKAFLRYDAAARSSALRLLTMSAFRYLPQPGKRLLESRLAALVPPAVDRRPTTEPLLGDGPFFEQLADTATVTMRRPTFKYFHLWGLHPPLTHDESLEAMKAPFTRANAARQARGLLGLVDRFVSTFDRLRIYGPSLIAIVGDHGTAFDVRLVPVDPATRSYPDATAVATRRGYGLPLVLVKLPGATGPMRVSDVPISLGDLPRTIVDALGLTSDLPGTSMFTPDIHPTRSRRVLQYNPDVLRLTDDYFPPLTEFVVSGFSWLEESWRPTGRMFRPGEVSVHSAAPAYEWGQVLTFGATGSAGPYLGEGWADPESGLTWTQGKSARLRFVTPSTTSDVVLRAEVIPSLAGTAAQRAELFVGGRRIGAWSVASAGLYEVRIPKDAVIGGELDLTIVLPDAVAPRLVRADLADARVLALAWRRASLTLAPPEAAPKP